MLEQLRETRERFLRRTPHGRVDVVLTAQNLLGEPRSANELSRETYLASLSEHDRAHVADFLTYASELRALLNEVGLAVTVVGSSTRPESERHHPIEDIDLRILNSAPPGSEQRQQVVESIKNSIRAHLQTMGMKFEEDNVTVSSIMVRSTSGSGQRELEPFLDWYNDDPSFVVKYPEGLPLHISISGLYNLDLDRYLRKEREHNGRFALLLGAK